MKEIASKIKLTANNLHLKNIFADNSYLELGNIHYSVISRLLNKEIVGLDEITNYPIQNKGIGHSDLDDEYQTLKNILPFIFYKNINQKEVNKQLVITYGIVCYKNEDKRSIYLPAILLPVNLYFEDSKAYVQMIVKPFENPVLSSVFSEVNRLKLFGVEKLDSIYSFDNLLFSIQKTLNLDVKLENYLSYVCLSKEDIIIDHNRFNKRLTNEFDSTHLFDAQRQLYYSTLLNKGQRKVLNRSLGGQDIIINGRIGTGKTTALINIAFNFMMQGRRVLYVSNNRETLTYVSDFFASKKLENYVANFTKTFASLLDVNSNFPVIKSNDLSEKLDGLTEAYKFVDDYERSMCERINDCRFYEIVNKLALLSDFEVDDIMIDDLSYIYRHEYEEILTTLKVIAKNIAKLQSLNVRSLKDSIWREIPKINQVKYANQILILIHKIAVSFKDLYNCKQRLEANFNFQTINNYATIKKIMHGMESFNYQDIPSIWIEPSSKNFKEAEYEFNRLKNYIYKIQDVEYALKRKYKGLSDVNIDKEIKTLLGDYYTIEDKQYIDLLNHNHGEIALKIGRIETFYNSFLKKSRGISRKMNWDFMSDDQQLKQMIKLCDFLEKVNLGERVFAIVRSSNHRTIIDRINYIQKSVAVLESENNNYFNSYPRLSDNDEKELVKQLSAPTGVNRRFSSSLKKYFAKATPSDILSAIKKKNENLKEIRSLKDEYQSYTKLPYDTIDSFVNDLNITYQYFMSINDNAISKKIFDFFKNELINVKRRKDKWTEFLSDTSKLKRSYIELESFINGFTQYHLFKDSSSFTEKIKEITNITAYIDSVFQSNQKIRRVIGSNTYVKFDQYLSIKDELEQYNQLINSLNEDKKFPLLFEHLYKGEKTEIVQISRIMQSFVVYKENFASAEAFVKSFDMQDEIRSLINECKIISDEINEIFKIYCRIFKDGVSRYYYNSFESNLEYLDTLLHAKDELGAYLNITFELYTINKHHLPKLIEYIVNTEEPSSLVNEFMLKYAITMYDKYILDHQIVKKTSELQEKLKYIIATEEQLIKENEENCCLEIIRENNLRFSMRGIKNLDYEKYVLRSSTVKKLILTDTVILDNFLTNVIDEFDLVIIDDAHLLEANEYMTAMQGRQLIVCGEYQLHAPISNNLISKMRKSNTVMFDYRFDQLPKINLKYMQFLKSPIHRYLKDNTRIEVIDLDIEKKIYSLYATNKKVVINYFIEDLGKQRNAFEKLAKIFADNGLSQEEVVKALTTNINITNIVNGYFSNADYNIIDVDGYLYIDSEAMIANMIDNLLLCKQFFIVYDPNHYLVRHISSQFIQSIQAIISDDKVFDKMIDDEVIDKLAQYVEEYGCEVYSSHNDLSFYIVKNEKLYGVLINWDNKNIDDVLNNYRNYNFKKSNITIPIITLNKFDFIIGIKRAAKQLVEALQ